MNRELYLLELYENHVALEYRFQVPFPLGNPFHLLFPKFWIMMVLNERWLQLVLGVPVVPALPHSHVIMIWVLSNLFTLVAKHPTIMSSTFATIPAGFTRKSVGKLAMNVRCLWVEFSPIPLCLFHQPLAYPHTPFPNLDSTLCTAPCNLIHPPWSMQCLLCIPSYLPCALYLCSTSCTPLPTHEALPPQPV